MKRMIFGAVLALCIFSTAHAAPPVDFSYQGMLRNSLGEPMNGVGIPITFQLYDNEGDLVSLSSEVKVVDVVDGLFTVKLAAPSILMDSDGDSFSDGDEKWLGITVGADAELVPRLRIGSVPLALISSRMSGDIHTSPNVVVLGDTDGDRRVSLAATSDGTSITLLDSTASGSASMRGVVKGVGDGMAPSLSHRMEVDDDGDGLPENWSEQTAGYHRSSSKCVAHDWAISNGTMWGLQVTPDSTVQAESTTVAGAVKTTVVRKTHANGGTYEMKHQVAPNAAAVLLESCDPTGATMKAITTKGTGALGMTKMETGDSAIMVAEFDNDGDGHAEYKGVIMSDADGCESHLSADSDDDGVADFSAGGVVTDTSSEWSVSSKAGDGGNHTDGWNVLQADSRTRETLKQYFETGDVPTQEQLVDASGSTFRAINTKGTGSNFRVSMEATDSALLVLESDDDGDGNPEAAAKGYTRKAGAIISANYSLVVDPDDDGIPEHVVSLQASDATGKVQCYTDTDDDGVANTSVELDCGDTGARLAIKEKGGPWGPGGSGKRTIELAGEGDSARVLVDNDSDGDGTADKKLTITLRDAAGNMTLVADSDDDGVADVSAETLVNNDSATFRLNGLPPGSLTTETIAMTATPTSVHMEVGAAICDGTDWINFSDKNFKENFEKVDGAEILEKIAELPITQWNYKQDSENVKHIGPTAQDFKSAFGVGANDKSISTIDPSGIALAAIKELNKQNRELANQNQELAKQNAKLKKQMDDLARKVEKLAKEK